MLQHQHALIKACLTPGLRFGNAVAELGHGCEAAGLQ